MAVYLDEKEEERRKRENGLTIGQIAKMSKEEGKTYGQYVMEHGF